MNTLTPQPLTLEPQTPQEERTRTTSDVLLAAARYIEEHGWHKGSAVSADGRVCIVGAIKAVCFQDPDDFDWSPGAVAAVDVAAHHVGDYAHVWNDAPERTEAEVLSALREAARSL